MKLRPPRSRRYVVPFVHASCLLAAKHDPRALASTLEAQQPGLTVMLLENVFAPQLTAAIACPRAEVKCIVVGCVRLLCEGDELAARPPAWAKVLQGVLALLEPAAAAADDGDAGAEEEQIGYDAAYSQLRFAQADAHDALAVVPDARLFAAQTLKAHAAKLAPLLQQLPPEQSAALQALLA